MSKKSIIERQKKRILIVKKYSVLRQELKSNLKKANNLEEKFKIHAQLQNLPRDSALVRSI